MGGFSERSRRGAVRSYGVVRTRLPEWKEGPGVLSQGLGEPRARQACLGPPQPRRGHGRDAQGIRMRIRHDLPGRSTLFDELTGRGGEARILERVPWLTRRQAIGEGATREASVLSGEPLHTPVTCLLGGCGRGRAFLLSAGTYLAIHPHVTAACTRTC